MIKVVQNDSQVPAGLYGEYLDRLGAGWELVPLDRGQPFPEPAADDALVLLGGYMSVEETDRYPFLDDARAGLRSWVAADRPLLGICLGGQLLAAATGGKVTVNARGERGVMAVELTPAGVSDPLFENIPRRFFSMLWHNDSFDLPPDAVHLAATPTCPGQAFRLGTRAYGLQFHPELTAEIVAAWARRLELGPEPLEEFLRHEQAYRSASLQLFANFLALAGDGE